MDTATEAVSFLSVFNVVFTQVYTNNFRREWLAFRFEDRNYHNVPAHSLVFLPHLMLLVVLCESSLIPCH